MNSAYSYRRLVARLLLMVQLFMLTNAVVFRHAHRLPDGTVIVHAHPFLPKANGPVQPNDHTRQELIWLDAITDAPYLASEPVFFAFHVPDPLPLVAPTVALAAPVRWVTFTCFSHRGPPLA